MARPADARLVPDPLPTSLSNDLGLYDGLSGVFNQSITWGLPYLLGRSYLGDAEGLRDLATGIVIGGLTYVPLCLYEIRMSPSFIGWSTGSSLHRWRTRCAMAVTSRWSSWRPGSKSNVDGRRDAPCCQLWLSGNLKQIQGVPFGGILLPILVVTTLLCKSVGALILLVVGLLVLWSTRLVKTRLPLWVLFLAPILYEVTRSTGLWDGQGAVSLAQQWIDGDAASSLDYRLHNEDLLITKALVRPLLGWGGWSRARVFDASGRDITITDGMWIIALGNYGALGLASLTGIFLAPLAVLARRPGRDGSMETVRGVRSPCGTLGVVHA